MRLNIQGLIDGAKCYDMVRELRWSEGVECPHCHSEHVVKNGHDPVQKHCPHSLCRGCGRAFDDLTNTLFSAVLTSRALAPLYLDVVPVFYGLKPF